MLHATLTDPADSRRHVPSSPVFFDAARTTSLVIAQIAALWVINLCASAAAARLHSPVPGNVLGLTTLLALLSSGIVKASWLEPTATFLVKHLAFFFIPITIGLMGMGGLFALHGVGIVLTLVVSAAVGMAICGRISQHLIREQDTPKDLRRSEPNA